MIVVGSNVVAYCWLNGPRTQVAQRVRTADPQWHLPILWRSEVRSALSGYCRAGSLSWEQAVEVMSAAEQAIDRREHVVPTVEVLRISAASSLSACDCEFVALARKLSVPLVTEDGAILAAFPEIALSMEAFLEAGQSKGRGGTAQS